LSIKRKILKHISNIPGWSTKNKIVVFESDDWGSIRMPSITSFNRLEKLGLDLRTRDAERYNLNDTMARSSDLENLFEVLSKFKGVDGRSAVFTPICITANPDFEKIRDANLGKYFFEPFTTTLKKYPGCENSFDRWEEGIQHKLFIPQMHGREHLNVSAWMNALQKGEEQTLHAFNEGLWGFVPDQNTLPGIDYQAAFLLSDPDEIEYHKEIIQDGLDLFEKIFGYRALYFVPPNGKINNTLNATLVGNGILYRSSAKKQNESLGKGNTKKSYHYLGQTEKHGITYITRNCFFEPNQPGIDWVNSCIGDIDIAFRMKKPAIISSHRVNYIGTLNPDNAANGISQLDNLLTEIKKRWPNVQFMTTAQLGNLISHKI